VVTKYLSKLNEITNIIVCSGNHDLDARNSGGEKYSKWILKVNDLGIPADGKNLIFDGFLFTILPWWDGPELLNEIENKITEDSSVDKTK
ncbi:MAG: phosphohydrolase, partial [Candidatus Dadabacteria bacterium]|nr:phosphohydrolase [Candidatus Dadabacteria bacterium]